MIIARKEGAKKFLSMPSSIDAWHIRKLSIK
jgi:hypothetical protein